jgi:HK97 family phage major capsid protein
MSKLAQLREQRDLKARAANDLNAQTPADQRMPKEHADKMDSILLDIENIDNEITREKRIDQLSAPQDFQAQHEIALNAATKSPAKHSEDANALRAFMTGGTNAMNDADRLRMFARQTPDIRAAMSTTTNSEGGFTVATEYMKSLEIALKLYGGMRAAASALRTQSGAQMQFPTSDPTAEIGEIVGQNQPTTLGETVMGNIALDVYKYSSKKIALPFELIQDSFIDIEAYVQSILAMRLGRIQNAHFTVGTGTGQPFGIMSRAALGKAGATGQTATVTYDDLVDLEHSIDPLYRVQPGVGYMMHDSSLRVLRKVKDAQQRPIFVPGYEANALINGGAPDTLMGRPIYINQDMPVMAANAKSILFGQLNKYVVRDVMDLTLFRMVDSAFTLNGQVGFVGFMRSGGNLIDAGGANKFYQNSAT